MPGYRTEISHDLGLATAKERLIASAEWARGFSDISGSWNGNTFTFKVSVQGIGMRGSIAVGETSLLLDGHLPWIAMPFAGWLPRMIRTALEPRSNGATAVRTGEREVDSTVAELAASAPTVLYLHIPKAGGTTLGEFVFNQCQDGSGRDEGLLNSGVLFLSYGFIKDDGPTLPSHVGQLLASTSLRAVLGHFSFGLHEHLTRPSTYVTMLRDPVERVVSLYHYLQLEGRMDIEQFIAEPPIKEVDNDQVRRISGEDPAIGACTVEMLRLAQQNLQRHFSVVGVTERLEETLVLLERRLGWTKEVATYPRNVNPAKSRVKDVPERVMKAIRRRNELDSELYRFATEAMDTAIAAEGPSFAASLTRLRARQ